MLSPMLLEGLQNYVIIFPEVLLKNSPLPLCGSRAATSIVIFLGWIICLLSVLAWRGFVSYLQRNVLFHTSYFFPFGAWKRYQRFLYNMHQFGQQPHRWRWGCCCLWSLVSTVCLHSFILMKRWTFLGFQVIPTFFFCVVFLQVPCGSGTGFQPAGILVFNFLLTETPREDDSHFPGAALKCSRK